MNEYDIINMIGGNDEYDYTGGKVETNFDTLIDSLLTDSKFENNKDIKNDKVKDVVENVVEDISDSSDDSSENEVVGKNENVIESTELSDDETSNYTDYLDKLNTIMDKYSEN